MADSTAAITPEAFISPGERESVALAMDLYNVRAKEAAFEVAMACRMADEETVAFMGRLAATLDEMDWEQRRETAAKLRELAAVLGATATGSAAPGLKVVTDQTPMADEILNLAGTGDDVEYDADSATETSVPPAEEESDNAGSPPPAEDEGTGEATATDEIKDDTETIPTDPLSKTQRRWLSDILEEDDIARIEALPVHQRLDFAAKLGERYKKLGITRLGAAAKRQRAEQLIAFMGGKDYKQIAELDKNWAYTRVASNLPQMARSIRDRLTVEEIRVFIPRPKPPKKPTAETSPEAAEEAVESIPLTDNQKKWYAKVYDKFDEVEAELAALTAEQRERLANLLSLRLNAAIVRRHGVAKTHRRIEQMTLFINGATYEEIAAAVSLPVAQVKSDLHDTTVKLKSNITQEDLRTKVQKAKSKQEVAISDGSQ